MACCLPPFSCSRIDHPRHVVKLVNFDTFVSYPRARVYGRKAGNFTNFTTLPEAVVSCIRERNRAEQFTRGGRLPDTHDFWRRHAPMLHAMNFEENRREGHGDPRQRGDGGERHPPPIEPGST
jgi:hypothetical protein